MDTLGDILVKALSNFDNHTLKQTLDLQINLLTYENEELSSYVKNIHNTKKGKTKGDLSYLLAATLIYRLSIRLNKDSM
jgi:hypothetical protein